MLVELRGGLIVRSEAIALGCALERRGHALSVGSNGMMQVTFSSRLTPDDVQAIRQHRAHLIACAAYRAPEQP